jgi:hypothetical protein
MSPPSLCAAVGLCLLALPLPWASGGEPIEKLQAERIRAATKAFEFSQRRFLAGACDGETVYLWSLRLLKAQQAVDIKPEPNRAALAAHLKRMEDLEKAVTARFKAGGVTSAELNAAAFYRIEARLWLAQAKEKAEK